MERWRMGSWEWRVGLWESLFGVRDAGFMGTVVLQVKLVDEVSAVALMMLRVAAKQVIF